MQLSINKIVILLFVLNLLVPTDSAQQGTQNSWSVGSLAYDAGHWTMTNEWIFEVFVVDPQHPKPKSLTLGSKPEWSPDGKKIVFCYFEKGRKPELYTIDPDGSDRKQLTRAKGGTGACSPSWSPDGSKIAYSAQDGSHWAVWVVNSDGTGSQRITEGQEPRWSPDGKRLAFFRSRGGAGTKSTVWTVNMDGSQATQIGEEGFVSWEPSWTADGRVLFASNREGKSAIYIAQPDGTNLRQFAHSAAYDLFAPVLSPDGKLLVVDAVAGHNGSEILLVDLGGQNKPQQLATGTHPSVRWVRQ